MRIRFGGRRLAVLAGLAVSLCLVPAVGTAVVPERINYQGYLTDTGGNPVSGTHQMILSLYDDVGTPLWTETHPSVTVENGVFRVQLGEVTALSLPFDRQYFLGIAVGGDPEMTPLQPLLSVPYALRADNADLLNGYDGTHYLDWDNLNGVPGGFSDGTDNDTPALTESEVDSMVSDNGYLDTELDPTVPANIKDGVDWSEIVGVPADIADGDDDQPDSDAEVPDAVTVDNTSGGFIVLEQGVAPASTTIGRIQWDTDDDLIVIGNGAQTVEFVNKTYVDALEARIAALEDLLTHFSRADNEITIAGANLNVVNGTGTTDDAPNGTGNLVVGYNELRGTGDTRSGSHTLVLGAGNNFSSFGGIVAGRRNTISAAYASVTGGESNVAEEWGSSISGGFGNTVTDYYSTVCGGYNNVANGDGATIVGGHSNIATGYWSLVGGGRNNENDGNYSVIVGGDNNFLDWTSGSEGEESTIIGSFNFTGMNEQHLDLGTGAVTVTTGP